MFFRKKVNEIRKSLKCAQGDIVPIENVPDSVFADKLLGDGIAIQPRVDGEIISPIDGTSCYDSRQPSCDWDSIRGWY